MEILIGTDEKTGLPMYREFVELRGSLINESIIVYYNEWLQSPTNYKLNLITKTYSLQAEEFNNRWMMLPIKATDDGLDINGTIIPKNHTVYFGKNLIVDVINQVLLELPFDVDGAFFYGT